MRNLANAVSAIAMVSTVAICQRATAQVSVVPAVGEQIAKARKTGEFGFATRLLLRQDSVSSPATLNALGDSLVDVVLAGTVATVHDREVHTSAIEALMVSANARARIKYAGAGVRLFRIAMEAPDMGDRAAAIFAIAVMANTTEALELLRRIAVSNNPVATSAIANLWDMMPDKGGLNVLRQLWRSGAVTEETARREMERVARRYGWKK